MSEKLNKKVDAALKRAFDFYEKQNKAFTYIDKDKPMLKKVNVLIANLLKNTKNDIREEMIKEFTESKPDKPIEITIKKDGNIINKISDDRTTIISRRRVDQSCGLINASNNFATIIKSWSGSSEFPIDLFLDQEL